jgi:cytochrome c1
MGGLADYADEFEAAAEAADHQAEADAMIVLAAVSRGEQAPADVARRVKKRAGVPDD